MLSAATSTLRFASKVGSVRRSPRFARTRSSRSREGTFILATEGPARGGGLRSGEPCSACAYGIRRPVWVFPAALAGISTVNAIKNNPIDIKATGRLNKLYVELLKDNPDWATADRRRALNQFMARLIFLFLCRGYWHLSWQTNSRRPSSG